MLLARSWDARGSIWPDTPPAQRTSAPAPRPAGHLHAQPLPHPSLGYSSESAPSAGAPHPSPPSALQGLASRVGKRVKPGRRPPTASRLSPAPPSPPHHDRASLVLDGLVCHFPRPSLPTGLVGTKRGRAENPERWEPRRHVRVGSESLLGLVGHFDRQQPLPQAPLTRSVRGADPFRGGAAWPGPAGDTWPILYMNIYYISFTRPLPYIPL